MSAVVGQDATPFSSELGAWTGVNPNQVREEMGCEQQRVAVIRALATEPNLMLFDEVTSALDPELVAGVLDGISD